MADVELMELLQTVVDPEIPKINIVDLGMVESAQRDDGTITVTLIPTFIGCSAQSLIAQEVRERLQSAFPGQAVDVHFSLTVPWSTERITAAGRQALVASGIAPPTRDLAQVVCPFCGQTDHVLENLFASTSCRSLFYCRACRNPFEAFKPL
jgi:ring-1,2-phenylacetyl-CoA epoxidase subunit PaaD